MPRARRAHARTATQAESADVAAFRGGLRAKRAGENAHLLLLGLRVVDTPALLERIQAGLAYGALERFQRSIALTLEQLAALIQVNPRTLARRRSEGKLAADESDRLLPASRLFGKALALFEGDADAAREWLRAQAPPPRRRAPPPAGPSQAGGRAG